MSESIRCRSCASPDCRGCNIYTLAVALENGRLDLLMDDNRAIRVIGKVYDDALECDTADNCRFCHQAPVINDGYFYEGDNEIRLVSGGWTSLNIGVNADGDVVMRACGDNYTEDYFPKYCPECGRKLKKEAGCEEK